MVNPNQKRPSLCMLPAPPPPLTDAQGETLVLWDREAHRPTEPVVHQLHHLARLGVLQREECRCMGW
jgi:hypothetical protein